MRTPGLGGFQLLDLHDYLGQGTALVGLLDAFWEPKGYATADEFKQFCNTTVPLARLRQRVFTTADAFEVDVELAHFGAEPIENAMAVWRIAGPMAQGEWEPRTIPIGKNFPLGKISVDLSKFQAPGEYKLVVTVAPASFFSPVDRKIVPGPGVVRGVTYFENDWNFWVYPANPEAQASQRACVTPDALPAGARYRCSDHQFVGRGGEKVGRRRESTVRSSQLRSRLDQPAARHRYPSFGTV